VPTAEEIDADRAAREARHAERARLVHADDESVVEDLRLAGVFLSSVYDLLKVATPRQAIPVLLRHLDVEHLSQIREGIIRALGEPGTREWAFDRLCKAFREERDPHLQWVTANALSGMASLQEVSELPGIQQYADLFSRRKRKG
jgi:hypothetical protein